MKKPASQCAAPGELTWVARLDAAGLVVAVAAFSALLWPMWLHDDNMAHGAFLPFLAGILFYESRRDPAPRFLRPGALPALACACLVLAALVGLAVAVVYATALGWNHAVSEFMLAVALACALGAGWVGFAGERVRFVPFNWAAGTGVVLWLFASAPPPGTYARLALFLQSQVTHGVVRVLGALGIAAYQDGNVIELARAVVGVSEACSGVRSLISCTVAGLFLSALVVRKPFHRVLVIVVSPAIGLGMNFLRSLLLTLLANRGVNIEGRWHDLTGASILVCTTLMVAAFGMWLRRREPPPVVEASHPTRIAGGSPPLAVVAAALLAVAAAAGLLAAHGRGAPGGGGREPDLAALLPEPPPGWTARDTPNLDRYSGVLRTNALAERVYYSEASRAAGHVTLYVAYWKPGQAPVSLVDAHTPDACWPGTGWQLEPVRGRNPVLGIGGRMLAPAEYRLFSLKGHQTQVWFWHLYGGRPLTFIDPYSATRLLGLALRYGFGEAKDQLFVRVSSDRPWDKIASQPILMQFFTNLAPLGI